MSQARGHEMGMDFEWQNQTGQLDARSPFAQLSPNAPRVDTPGRRRNNHNTTTTAAAATTTATDSPFKSVCRLPPSSSARAAAFNALYSTPRKPNPDPDDSSAGETPASPDRDDADSDATPDLGARRRTGRRDVAATTYPATTHPAAPGAEAAGRDRGSPAKERPHQLRRESWWWGKLKTKINSPGRGEIARPEHSGAVEKRVKKRREKQLQRQTSSRRRRNHSVSDDSGDDDGGGGGGGGGGGKHPNGHAPAPAPAPAPASKPHWISALFTFIAQHPTVPHILSFYAQLAFNVFLLAGCGYLVYSFWAAVQGDVDKKSHEAMADIMAEMAECARHYTSNRCDPSQRLPALDTVCRGWQRCMDQDPHQVGRAKVSAHTFAEIFNSFVEPISWKAMAFTFLLVFACFATTNLAFGFFRDKTAHAAQQYPPHYYPHPPPPPPTPQPAPPLAHGHRPPPALGTPWHHAPPLDPPSPSGYAAIEARGSPVRRLQYH